MQIGGVDGDHHKPAILQVGCRGPHLVLTLGSDVLRGQARQVGEVGRRWLPSDVGGVFAADIRCVQKGGQGPGKRQGLVVRKKKRARSCQRRDVPNSQGAGDGV